MKIWMPFHQACTTPSRARERESKELVTNAHTRRDFNAIQESTLAHRLTESFDENVRTGDTPGSRDQDC